MPWLCIECQKLNADDESLCCHCKEPAPDDADRVPFELVDRYRIVRVISTGGMGRVFRGWDREKNRPVAIKEMLVTSVDPEERQYAQARFMQEVDFLGRLNHQALPRLVDFFVVRQKKGDGIIHYLVMEYISGQDLGNIMKDLGGKPMDTPGAMSFFLQLLDVLSYLHYGDPPIVYRDLKPSNVMIRQGKLFLVDFGIAREYNPGSKGTQIGTPGYAAPEQYQGICQPRSDLYSLGVLMHYLLTGIDPEGDDRPTFTFEPVKELNRDVPDTTSELIGRMLSLPVRDRPSSALDVYFQLDAVKATRCLLGSLARQAGLFWTKFVANFIPGSSKSSPGKTRFHILR